ncbi:aminoglycoside phosphotransferase family protein [Bradyrhizobium sp. USDA 10063]
MPHVRWGQSAGFLEQWRLHKNSSVDREIAGSNTVSVNWRSPGKVIKASTVEVCGGAEQWPMLQAFRSTLMARHAFSLSAPQSSDAVLWVSIAALRTRVAPEKMMRHSVQSVGQVARVKLWKALECASGGADIWWQLTIRVECAHKGCQHSCMHDSDMQAICGFLAEVAGARSRDEKVEVKAMRGGLESGVALVTSHVVGSGGRLRSVRFVLKRLEGRMMREADIYERLALWFAAESCPRLLRIIRFDQHHVYLCLEAVRRASAWPWADVSLSRELLTRMARFHVAATGSDDHCPFWNYDADLERAALETLDALERSRNVPALAMFTRDIPPVRRMALAHAKLRCELLSGGPLSARPIHGDLHTGNALARRRASVVEPILLDWGRARVGSPLEDVSSWLQTLGVWAPEIRCRHDSLFADYLAALGMERKLTPSIQNAYWLAGCSNALSGALAHHLRVAANADDGSRRRSSAVRLALAWLRIIRRADSCWS